MHAKGIVKHGYNKIASSYMAARTADSKDVQLLNLLAEYLPQAATVLDVGCGSGHPVAQFLVESFQVTGIDFAEEQIRLAKARVPDAWFVCADMTSKPFEESSFDAVCSYYTIIHVPRVEHPKLLVDLHRILRPGGLALLCMGAGDLPKDIDDYYDTQMYWSHYDNKTNLSLMGNSFNIIWFETLEDPLDPPATHLFVLGQKSSRAPLTKLLEVGLDGSESHHRNKKRPISHR